MYAEIQYDIFQWFVSTFIQIQRCSQLILAFGLYLNNFALNQLNERYISCKYSLKSIHRPTFKHVNITFCLRSEI